MVSLGRRAMRWVLGALFAVIFVGSVAHAVYIDVFNKTEHTVTGADETQQSYLKFSDREDSTSKWVKRDYDLYGQTTDIWAQTVDGTFFNDSDDAIESWKLTINIEGDCFINNAWTGTMEIHQFVGTDREAVQTLDLRSYAIADVELTHLYDGDLLIPLQKGDYLVYYPSVEDELEIAPHSELTMGMIFYYLDDLNLSDYTVEYYYHRDFTYGFSFVVLASLAVLWVLLLVGIFVSDASYKRAMKDMELRKSGLASMSSIYSIISYIDLENDQLTNVYTDPKTKGKLPEGAGAREGLLAIFGRDTAEPYRDVVLEFVDTKTLPERLESESIACEYVSKAYGWSRVRFFAVDREEGQPLKNVLFTIQDINAEKRELSRFEERAVHAEYENKARNAFISSVSNSMSYPIQDIIDFDERILDEVDEGVVHDLAKRIKSRARLLSYMVAGTSGASARADGGYAGLAFGEYSFAAMVDDVEDIASTMLDGRGIELETDIAQTFPDRLVGDALGIERALIGLFAHASRQKGCTRVKLSIFGRLDRDEVHLLCSVHLDGSGLTQGETAHLAAFAEGVEDEGIHVVGGKMQELEMTAVQLSLAGSKLQVVDMPGEECEFYFELDQHVATPSAGADENAYAD